MSPNGLACVLTTGFGAGGRMSPNGLACVEGRAVTFGSKATPLPSGIMVLCVTSSTAPAGLVDGFAFSGFRYRLPNACGGSKSAGGAEPAPDPRS